MQFETCFTVIFSNVYYFLQDYTSLFADEEIEMQRGRDLLSYLEFGIPPPGGSDGDSSVQKKNDERVREGY